jgi:hypothetical protein
VVKRGHEPSPGRLGLVLVLIGPISGSVAVLFAALLLRSAQLQMRSEAAGRIFAACYAIGSSVSLFLERERAQPSRKIARSIEVAVGIVGLCIAFSLLLSSIRAPEWSDVRIGLYNAIVGAALIFPRRTDRVGAATFILLAIAAIRWPLLSTHFPFISLTIFWIALALACLMRVPNAHTIVSRVFSVAVFANVACVAFGIYVLTIAYPSESVPGMLIGTLTVLFCGAGILLIIARGTWSERHPRH